MLIVIVNTKFHLRFLIHGKVCYSSDKKLKLVCTWQQTRRINVRCCEVRPLAHITQFSFLPLKPHTITSPLITLLFPGS